MYWPGSWGYIFPYCLVDKAIRVHISPVETSAVVAVGNIHNQESNTRRVKFHYYFFLVIENVLYCANVRKTALSKAGRLKTYTQSHHLLKFSIKKGKEAKVQEQKNTGEIICTTIRGNLTYWTEACLGLVRPN